MKNRLLLIGSAMAMALTGCNSIGSGEEIIARIDSEVVYSADVDLAVKLDYTGRSEMDNIVSSLFSKTALVGKAVADYPELETRWKDYHKNLEDRVLTLVYQRYFAMECLMFPETELREFFDSNKAMFLPDSAQDVEFLDVRGKVAEKLLLSKNAEAIKAKNNDTVLFLNEFRKNLQDSTIKTVKEKFPVTIEKIVPPDPEGYYNAHKDEFKTALGFELYHIQMEDSAALAKVVAGKTLDLETFKSLAAKYSENKETAANGGYVGYVKDGYSMPYGIGIINGLAAALQGKPEGTVSPILGSTRTPGRHVFYLVREVPPEVKPYERAKADVMNSLLSKGYLELPEDYVLVSKNGAPFVTEKTILSIFREEPGMRKDNSMRDRIVRSLAESASFADEARLLKLDRSWEFKAFMRQVRHNYILTHYEDFKEGKYKLSEDSLKSYFEKNGNPVRPSAGFEDSRKDIDDYVTFPENVLKRDYYFNHVINKNRSIDDVRKQVFSNRIRDLRKARDEREEADVYAKAKVFIYKSGLSVKPPVGNLPALLQAADSLYKARQYDRAIEKWKKVRDLYPENDSLFAKATFQIAQIQSEAEQYSFAEAEYFVFYSMWPDSPDAEKALFSRGFILNENLHQDEEALKVLEEFQQKYPKSELKESVDWLVDNIKSGGKLAEDLLKKISEE